MIGTPSAKASWKTVETHQIRAAKPGSERLCSCGERLRSNRDVTQHVVNMYEEFRSRFEYEEKQKSGGSLPDPPDLIVL